MDKLVRFLPHTILLICSIVFLFIDKLSSNPLIQSVAINLASNGLFIVIAYSLYDFIKSRIVKRDEQYITNYIEHHIFKDIIVVLYTMKKYLYGYNLATNTVLNILDVGRYKQDQIKAVLINQVYMGFIIFKKVNDITNIFNGAINNAMIIKYGSRDHIINLLKIISLLSEIEAIYRDEGNFLSAEEQRTDFIVVDGEDISSQNEGYSLLFKRTEIPKVMRFYDDGKFDQKNRSKLLSTYLLKPEVAEFLSEKFYDLNSCIKIFLPDSSVIKEDLDKYEKIMKEKCMKGNTYKGNNLSKIKIVDFEES